VPISVNLSSNPVTDRCLTIKLRSPLAPRAVSFDLGAVPRVPAPMPETHMKSSVEGVGTGALPLQNDDFSENETALP
jgi:hypothetical protein